MKRTTALLTAIMLCACPAVSAVMTAHAAAQEDDIVILYTNDVHCGITDHIGYDVLALYKKEMESAHAHDLLADAGDAIQGGTIGTMTIGAALVELMDAVGYDVCVPGNHEFDYSIPELMARADELDCGYICCNLFVRGKDTPVFTPYRLFDLGDTTIAFVGVTTPETFSASTPVYFQNDAGEYIYSFSEDGTTLYDVIQANVDTVREQGADTVILLGHLGEHDVTDAWSAPTIAANTTGIDAVIDGHSHEVTPSMVVQNKEGQDVVITQTGTKLANLGKMTIAKDGAITTELVDTVPAPGPDSGIPDEAWHTDAARGRNVDTAMNERILALEAQMQDQLGQKVGETAFPLFDTDSATGMRRVRNGETDLGDLIADSFRAAFGTDVGFINGGGLRAAIPAGDITYSSLMTVMPYNNTVHAARVTGQQLLDLLEFSSAAYPGESGAFLHVSGMTYAIDPAIPSSVTTNEFGEFTGVTGEYRVKDVKIGDAPLDLTKTYTVASINYLLYDGGDGFILSGHCEMLDSAPQIDREVTAAYLQNELGGIVPESYRDPYGQGRIQILTAAEEPTPAQTSPAPAAGGQHQEASSPATGDTGITAILLSAMASLAAFAVSRKR